MDNTLLVKFVADESVARDGFTANYEFLDASEGNLNDSKSDFDWL